MIYHLCDRANDHFQKAKEVLVNGRLAITPTFYAKNKITYLFLADIKLFSHHAKLQRGTYRLFPLPCWVVVFYWGPNPIHLVLQKISQLLNRWFIFQIKTNMQVNKRC
jgi:hypothetical protein